MRIWVVLVVMLVTSSGCWIDDSGFCHVQPSQYSEDVFEQTCNGSTTTYTVRGCNGDEDYHPKSQCENACSTKAICCQNRSSLAGGTCSATICGG